MMTLAPFDEIETKHVFKYPSKYPPSNLTEEEHNDDITNEKNRRQQIIAAARDVLDDDSNRNEMVHTISKNPMPAIVATKRVHFHHTNFSKSYVASIRDLRAVAATSRVVNGTALLLEGGGIIKLRGVNPTGLESLELVAKGTLKDSSESHSNRIIRNDDHFVEDAPKFSFESSPMRNGETYHQQQGIKNARIFGGDNGCIRQRKIVHFSNNIDIGKSIDQCALEDSSESSIDGDGKYVDNISTSIYNHSMVKDDNSDVNEYDYSAEPSHIVEDIKLNLSQIATTFVDTYGERDLESNDTKNDVSSENYTNISTGSHIDDFKDKSIDNCSAENNDHKIRMENEYLSENVDIPFDEDDINKKDKDFLSCEDSKISNGKRVNDTVPHCVPVYSSDHSYVNSEEDEINDRNDENHHQEQVINGSMDVGGSINSNPQQTIQTIVHISNNIDIEKKSSDHCTLKYSSESSIDGGSRCVDNMSTSINNHSIRKDDNSIVDEDERSTELSCRNTNENNDESRTNFSEKSNTYTAIYCKRVLESSNNRSNQRTLECDRDDHPAKSVYKEDKQTNYNQNNLTFIPRCESEDSSDLSHVSSDENLCCDKIENKKEQKSRPEVSFTTGNVLGDINLYRRQMRSTTEDSSIGIILKSKDDSSKKDEHDQCFIESSNKSSVLVHSAQRYSYLENKLEDYRKISGRCSAPPSSRLRDEVNEHRRRCLFLKEKKKKFECLKETSKIDCSNTYSSTNIRSLSPNPPLMSNTVPKKCNRYLDEAAINLHISTLNQAEILSSSLASIPKSTQPYPHTNTKSYHVNPPIVLASNTITTSSNDLLPSHHVLKFPDPPISQALSYLSPTQSPLHDLHDHHSHHQLKDPPISYESQQISELWHPSSSLPDPPTHIPLPGNVIEEHVSYIPSNSRCTNHNSNKNDNHCTRPYINCISKKESKEELFLVDPPSHNKSRSCCTSTHPKAVEKVNYSDDSPGSILQTSTSTHQSFHENIQNYVSPIFDSVNRYGTSLIDSFATTTEPCVNKSIPCNTLDATCKTDYTSSAPNSPHSCNSHNSFQSEMLDEPVQCVSLPIINRANKFGALVVEYCGIISQETHIMVQECSMANGRQESRRRQYIRNDGYRRTRRYSKEKIMPISVRKERKIESELKKVRVKEKGSLEKFIEKENMKQDMKSSMLRSRILGTTDGTKKLSFLA